MKITRTSQAALSAQQRSQLANAGCAVLYVSNGLRACLGLAICELTAIVALLVERNGKARRMK